MSALVRLRDLLAKRQPEPTPGPDPEALAALRIAHTLDDPRLDDLARERLIRWAMQRWLIDPQRAAAAWTCAIPVGLIPQ